MSRETHVQFCERLGVKLPGATHPPRIVLIRGFTAWLLFFRNGFEKTDKFLHAPASTSVADDVAIKKEQKSRRH
jgi:hypothetical protein